MVLIQSKFFILFLTKRFTCVRVVLFGKMASPPQAPSSLPKYLAEGLPKQDVETLEDTQEYVQTLIKWMNRPVDIEVDEDEELVEVEESSKGARVEKKVPCGKNCNGCPHGPYEYRVYRSGGDVVWDYVGPVDS